MMRRRFAALAAIAALLLVGGCASPKVAEQPAAEFADAGLYRVTGTGFEEAYVRRDAALADYAAIAGAPLALDKLEIAANASSGGQRRDWALTPERAQRLEAIWGESLESAFAGYSRGGQGALRIEAALTRVAATRAASSTTTTAGATGYATSEAVDLSAEFRLLDGDSGQLLAVIRDTQRLPVTSWSRGAGVEINDQFRRWAGLLHARVSRAGQS